MAISTFILFSQFPPFFPPNPQYPQPPTPFSVFPPFSLSPLPELCPPHVWMSLDIPKEEIPKRRRWEMWGYEDMGDYGGMWEAV